MINDRQDRRDAPPELAGAMARIGEAKDNYDSLANEMQEFLCEYIGGMVRGRERGAKNFTIQLRNPKDSIVRGKPQVLVAHIVENLRTALDYMTYELSLLNDPSLNNRKPQFVIASTKADFEQQARQRLSYLTDEQRSFVERIQPYNGNQSLELMGRWAVASKHRQLLSLCDNTSFDIHLDEIRKSGEYKDCFVYPVEDDHAVYAKPKGKGILVLLSKYDAMPTLADMIEQTEETVRVSFCFFEGRPLNLEIEEE